MYWKALIQSVAICFIATTAYADFIVYSSTFQNQTFSLGTKVGGSTGSSNLSTLSWNASLGLDFALPQFDPNLGTLDEVGVLFAGTVSSTADVLFANNQLAPFNIAGINYSLTTTIEFNDATRSTATTTTTPLGDTVTATSSASPFSLPIGSASFQSSIAAVPASQIANYRGTSNLLFPMTINFSAQATTSNGAFAVTPFPTIGITAASVVYVYTPITAVPEPSSFALLLLACVVLWLFGARAYKQNLKLSHHGLKDS